MPLVAFVTAFVAITVANNGLQAWLLGPEPSYVENQLSQFPAYLLLAAATVLVLRVEGVPLVDLGLRKADAETALVAVLGFLVALNVIVAGWVSLSGRPLSFGVYVLYARLFDHGPLAMAVGAGSAYLVVGPVEEFAVRGYLQNKLIALVGGVTERFGAALGIGLTAVLFAVIHLPDLVFQEGVGLGSAIGSLLLLSITALVFGAIYEWTRNLYLVAMLHGIGDYWLLVVDPGAWPNWGIVILLYGLLVLGYRQWVTGDGERRSGVPA